jgi:hypothetical protein
MRYLFGRQKSKWVMPFKQATKDSDGKARRLVIEDRASPIKVCGSVKVRSIYYLVTLQMARVHLRLG